MQKAAVPKGASLPFKKAAIYFVTYRLITKQLQATYGTEAIASHISKLHPFPPRVRETCTNFMEAHVFPYSLLTFLNIVLEGWHKDPAVPRTSTAGLGKSLKATG